MGDFKWNERAVERAGRYCMDDRLPIDVLDDVATAQFADAETQEDFREALQSVIDFGNAYEMTEALTEDFRVVAEALKAGVVVMKLDAIDRKVNAA